MRVVASSTRARDDTRPPRHREGALETRRRKKRGGKKCARVGYVPPYRSSSSSSSSSSDFMRFTMHVLFAFSHTHLGSQFIRKNFFFVEKKELQIFRRFSSFVVSSSARRLSAFDERQRRRRALRGCVLRFALAFRVEEEERFFFVSSFGAFREREREKRFGSI